VPVYVYRCHQGHISEARVPVELRDGAQPCQSRACGETAQRVFTPPQRVIVRPAGYSLKPGDRGYWDFEGASGRLASHEQRSIAPYAKAEALYKAPPKPGDDEAPVVI
jgi:hypothetical protein